SHIDAKVDGTGSGGKITIVADNILQSPDSTFDVSSALGTSGTVDIQARIGDLSGSLAPLPENVLQAASLSEQSCVARFGGGKLSSLALAGRDAFPLEPGAVMPSPLYRLADSSMLPISEESRQSPPTLLTSLRLNDSKVSPCA